MAEVLVPALALLSKRAARDSAKSAGGFAVAIDP